MNTGKFFFLGVVMAVLILGASSCRFHDKTLRSVNSRSNHALPRIETLLIPAGGFIRGSSQSEREYAYSIDEEAYGRDTTRRLKWYDREHKRETVYLPAFEIMQTPVTHELYQLFIEETGHPAPKVDEETWRGYKLIHPYKRTLKFQWQDDKIPEGREKHPVVLVSALDAQAFAKWLSMKTSESWKLPTALEWEKAARGVDGRYFPWGDVFDGKKLNSHDEGPFDTVVVGAELHQSPFGVRDVSGQVFEWTSTGGAGRTLVKGGSWDDKGCGVCRCAAEHFRSSQLKHILIGFRLVKQVSDR